VRNEGFPNQPPRAADLPPICRCLLPQETPPQQKFTHISRSKIMIFGREIFVCEMCCFCNDERQKKKKQETHTIFITLKIHVRL